MPDFMSWHPYTTWQHVTYTQGTGAAYQVPVEPSPFPETAASGDGNGSDLGTGATETHTGSVACANSVDEYSVTYTDSVGPHYGACGDAIAGTGPSDPSNQISKMKALAQKYKITVDGTNTGNPVLWATEGGYSQYYNMQGTDDEVPESTSMTRRNFLRRNYMARWLITLAGRGVSVAIPYSYDLNGGTSANACYMAQFVPLPSTSPAQFGNLRCTLPDRTGDSTLWGTGYVYNVYSASNNTSIGAGPLGGGGHGGGDGFDANYNTGSGSSSDHGLVSSTGLTVSGQAYNTVYTWIHGSQVFCNDEDTTNSLYHCDVYNSSKTYIGTIFWNYKWNGLTTGYTPVTKGGAFTDKWYVDSTSGIAYTSGTISVSGEPVFYYDCHVSGTPAYY